MPEASAAASTGEPHSDRTVLITGASDGIGLALARAMLARGDRVLGLQRRSSPLSGAPGFRQAACDLSQHSSIDAAVAALLGGVERLDLVVLNAAISTRIADLGDTPLADIQHLMDVNTWSNKRLIDALYARLLPVAQVVGISSGAAVNASRGWNGYALSKATFVMLLALYAAERPETHFCSLAPGIVQTRMQDDLNGATPDQLLKFPALSRLREARDTGDMPLPDVAAPLLLEAFDRVRDLPSGGFASLKSLGIG